MGCIFKSSGVKCISVSKLCEVLKLNESSLITWVSVPDSLQIYSTRDMVDLNVQNWINGFCKALRALHFLYSHIFEAQNVVAGSCTYGKQICCENLHCFLEWGSLLSKFIFTHLCFPPSSVNCVVSFKWLPIHSFHCWRVSHCLNPGFLAQQTQCFAEQSPAAVLNFSRNSFLSQNVIPYCLHLWNLYFFAILVNYH